MQPSEKLTEQLLKTLGFKHKGENTWTCKYHLFKFFQTPTPQLYFPKNEIEIHDKKQLSHFLSNLKERTFTVFSEVETTNDTLLWIGKLDNGEEVCRFQYFKDKAGKIWLNNIHTEPDYTREGFGTEMIRKAQAFYGEIYIFTGTRQQFNENGAVSPNDTRYPSDSGDLFVFTEKCIKKGILKREFLRSDLEISFPSTLPEKIIHFFRNLF